MAEDSAQIQKQIIDSISKGPHVVILGAGASAAAIPNGDKMGHKTSVMSDFIKNLGMEDLMSGVKLKTRSKNLEAIFSELSAREEYKDLTARIEKRIYDYYESLIIPDAPTAYDYLVISLRKKDYIFSFNWDNLLIQAYARCYRITPDLPELVFLHGNVNVAYCCNCHTPQRKDYKRCCQCGGELIPTPLLYPIKKKNYTLSEYIQKAWATLEVLLEEASVLTIFGYSAPKSDAAAVRIMKKAFANRTRWYDHFEVIDIIERERVYKTWAPFIAATHDHFTYHKSVLDDTLISNYPRRSIEGYVKQYYQGWFGTSGIKLKECGSMQELSDLVQPLLEREHSNDYTIIGEKMIR